MAAVEGRGEVERASAQGDSSTSKYDIDRDDGYPNWPGEGVGEGDGVALVTATSGGASSFVASRAVAGVSPVCSSASSTFVSSPSSSGPPCSLVSLSLVTTFSMLTSDGEDSTLGCARPTSGRFNGGGIGARAFGCSTLSTAWRSIERGEDGAVDGGDLIAMADDDDRLCACVGIDGSAGMLEWLSDSRR